MASAIFLLIQFVLLLCRSPTILDNTGRGRRQIDDYSFAFRFQGTEVHMQVKDGLDGESGREARGGNGSEYFDFILS